MNPLLAALRSRGTVYLLGTSLLGRLPSAMSALAIVQLVRLQGGDFAVAGAVTSVYIVAGALGQPVLGRIVDRRGQTAVIVVAGLASSAAFVGLAMLSAGTPVLGVVCAAAAGFFSPPLEPSLRSLWPTIAPGERELKAAYSLDAGAQEILFIVGPLLTVVGITAFGASGNVVFAAVLGLAGSLGFAAHTLSRSAAHSAGDLTGRRKSPLRARGFARLLVFAFGAGVPVGALTIAATSFEERHRLPGLAGWILAANALGALLGATAIALRPPKHRTAAELLAPFGLLLAAVYVPITLEDAPAWLYLIAAVLSGSMLPPTLAQLFERVHQLVPVATLTEANAWAVSAINVGIAVGTLGVGAFIDTGLPRAVPIAVGIAVVITATASLLVLHRRPLEPVVAGDPTK